MGTATGVVKYIYRPLRTIIFSAIIILAALFLSLYLLLSMPSVQNKIRGVAEKELTAFLGGRVKIGEVSIFPFNEVRLKNVELITPEGEKCIEIGTLGAGIHLWRLIKEREIEITYAEIISLSGKIEQRKKDGPLNIDYIIKALQPKDNSKPPTKFDLRIHNIVIRRSSISFERLWKTEGRYKKMESLDDISFSPDFIFLYDLKADLTLPQVKNDDFIIDLRRLSFKSFSGFDIEKLSFKALLTNHSLSVNDFILQVGESNLNIGDFSLEYDGYNQIINQLEKGDHHFTFSGSNVSPRDFRFFYPNLKNLTGRYDFALNVEGNIDNISISDFSLKQKGGGVSFLLNGDVKGIRDIKELVAHVNQLDFHFPTCFPKEILESVVPASAISQRVRDILLRIGELDLKFKGGYTHSTGELFGDGQLKSSLGDLVFDVSGSSRKESPFSGRVNVETSGFNIGNLIANDLLGSVALTADADLAILGKEISGKAKVDVEYIDFKGERFNNILIDAEKEGERLTGSLKIDDNLVNIDLDGEALLAHDNSHFQIDGEIFGIYPAIFGVLPQYPGYKLSGIIKGDVTGMDIDNLSGFLNLNDLSFLNGDGKGVSINRVEVQAENYNTADDNSDIIQRHRKISVNTDFLTATVDGHFKLNDLIPGVQQLLHENVTSLIPLPKTATAADSYANFEINIPADKNYPSFFKLPVKPLKDIVARGEVDLKAGKLELDLYAPYLLQGTNKLISNSRIYASVEREKGTSISVVSTIPIKNDRANIELLLTGIHDRGHLDLGWTMENNRNALGKVSVDASVEKNFYTGKPDITLQINPSTFQLGPSVWNIDESSISYSDKRLSVDNLRIRHDDQFLAINGVASAAPEDEINVRLADIDLEYIFGLLNINYVTFGGIATGEITGSSLFTKNPIAQTRRLHVANFSYNDAVLGEAELFSRWNNDEKEVEIEADISEEGFGGAKVKGGVFVTRDSLAFDMRADKINIEFLKPFMAAFTSDVGGRASGDVKLFGTFKDIDLTGRAFADSIYMKVDYTNVYYHGSDSVILDPGRIVIPSFRLYDKYGNSANFSGFVKHSYFHDPEFEFKLTDANKLLCYDTNSSINPDWYGRIFASGRGSLRGRPGIVTMEMDVTTNANSDFTFVLSDTQTALDYSFLSFSDKRKEKELSEIVVEETFEEKFRKKQVEEESVPSIFAMDLRATITPEAKMNLIMDPNAGDKITARGSGPLQIHYDTESDEMTMYGKYTLAEGSYNFSLQDLILRDFKIREGSNISFNGDPMAALIDIVAAYRVNTNLSDLDKSFSTDRDLNRTNVPVDALLKVKGDLQNPEISFDISLPTLTNDVERKVRSIISTEDLMSRQIIYLLALNRFYTPEYMGSTSNGGGELASVASSTLSSQLSNIMGQLTDKVTLSPSFRSDRGDFSDMEVDLSLSSRLLNNRLLINGNFGYRDRSTSQTTFVGDFDIEYLLSKNGNLRLKAYNHFNDQNYYLKSALTTQGIGIVYRKEFDNPFTWLRRKRKNDPSEDDDQELDKQSAISEEEENGADKRSGTSGKKEMPVGNEF